MGSMVALAAKLIVLVPSPLVTAPSKDVCPLIVNVAVPMALTDAVSSGLLVLIDSVAVPVPNATSSPVSVAKSILKLAEAGEVTPPSIAPDPLSDNPAELRELISPTD